MVGFNYGGGSKSSSSSRDRSITSSYGAGSSGSRQSLWAPQMRALQQMYGGAQGVAAGQGGIGQTAQGIYDQYAPGMAAGYKGLQNLAAGGGPLAQYAKPNNALARQQQQMMGQQLGQQFREELLPGIRGQAGLVGGMGAGREGVAQGMAADSTQRNMAYGASDLYAQQYGIGAQAAAGQTDAMLAAAGQMPGYAEGAMNLGMAPFEAQWMPYQAMAGVLGDPTVFTRQNQTNRTSSLGRSVAWQESSGKQGKSFGFSI